MADKLRNFSTNRVPTEAMGSVIDELMETAKNSRRGFERKWYDNNFFDDGYHFRFMSRTQNKITDLSQSQNIYNPLRAIPKASRQIRGVANLLVAQDPVPVIYPEKVSKSNFPDPEPQIDPTTGQQMPVTNPEYMEALEEAKNIAKKSGHWVQEEFKDQNLLEKLAFMVILTAKHGISFLQIWADDLNEQIKTQVYDAFDIWVLGDLTELEDVPFIGKTTKMRIAEIKANNMFDPAQVAQISPENRHASSEIKEAYMNARYGQGVTADQVATLRLKEFFIKEYLNADNIARIRRQEDGDKVLRNKKEGDTVIRQTYVAGNVWLRDKYTNLSSYPFVDLRLEPGPLYQVPLIERFIPQNKSYDMMMSRLERILHTTNMGILTKQKGQSFTITNDSGAQVVEYEGAKPEWLGMPSIPNSSFNMLGITQSNIEEQGVSTTTLGKLPTGVRANAAIESLKESEYANLTIATRRYRGTVKRIAEKFLELADDYFITPRTVYLLEKGEPQYFDILGDAALKLRKKLKIPTQDGVIPIKKTYKVDIQVESQLGYTQEGKKAAAKELADLMVQLLQLPVPPIPPQAIAIFLQQLLKAYEFGPTEEIMESIEEFINQGGADQTSQDSLDKMKLAMMEVMKDLQGSPVLPDAEQRIDETKVGTAEVLRDLQKGGSNASTV